MTADRERPQYAVDVYGWLGRIVGYAVPLGVPDTPRSDRYDITFLTENMAESYLGYPYSVETTTGHDGTMAGVTYLQMLTARAKPAASPQVSPQPVEKKTYSLFEPWMIDKIVLVRRVHLGDKEQTVLWVGRLATYALAPGENLYLSFHGDPAEEAYHIGNGPYVAEIEVFDEK